MQEAPAAGARPHHDRLAPFPAAGPIVPVLADPRTDVGRAGPATDDAVRDAYRATGHFPDRDAVR